MTEIVGIVAEYNPFHNGHIHQIRKIKEKYKDSIIIICMSSSFTQRGEYSIMNKWEKTEAALKNGADIVLELPYVYATQGSDVFAQHALEILNSIGVSCLCFGAERQDLREIEMAAKIQLYDLMYDKYVQRYLKEGISYPTALNKALKELSRIIIDEPNDLLALSYIREIYKNGYMMKTFNIKRTTRYHDTISNLRIVSAKNVRQRFVRHEDFQSQVPPETYEFLKNKEYSTKFFDYLKYKIISENDLTKYVDVDEGIDIRVKKVINKSNSYEELVRNIKTKRYTYNKITRMLNHILCSFTKEENKSVKKTEYVRILGFNTKGQKYLNEFKKDNILPTLNKYDTTKYKALAIEKRVSEIYSLIYEDIMDKEIRNVPVIIKEND